MPIQDNKIQLLFYFEKDNKKEYYFNSQDIET